MNGTLGRLTDQELKDFMLLVAKASADYLHIVAEERDDQQNDATEAWAELKNCLYVLRNGITGQPQF